MNFLKKVGKAEFKYILFSGAFVLSWFMFVMPKLVESFDGDSILSQFLLFNLGLFIFFFIFLKSISTNHKANLGASLGIIMLFFATDLLMPEYHVGIDGSLNAGASLGVSSSDYFIGHYATQFGLSGIAVYVVTYAVVPLLLMLLAANILPNFVKQL